MSQATLQQTPSTQAPLVQSPPPVQAAPSALDELPEDELLDVLAAVDEDELLAVLPEGAPPVPAPADELAEIPVEAPPAPPVPLT